MIEVNSDLSLFNKIFSEDILYLFIFNKLTKLYFEKNKKIS